MSFAVFGVTFDYCLQLARKKVSQHRRKGCEIETKSLDEWQQEVDEKAKELFERFMAGKAAMPKLSADLSQPAACAEFIRLCEQQDKPMSRLVIKQKQPVVQANGQPKLNKKKQPVLRYQPYPSHHATGAQQ